VHDRCSREAPVLQPPPRVGQGTGAEVAPSQLAACHVARFGVRWPVPVLVAD
jgi:hypothetical protein